MPPKARKADDACRECVFCGSAEDNETAYGKLLKKSGIAIHYFCMLFSSGLWQRGKRDQDGILGFMPADIRREQKRGQRLTCQYCKKKGATIGCVISNCRKTFHFHCGREAGGMCQFFQEFRSYCPEHRPRQVTPTSASDRLAFYGTAKSTCSICMLAVEARSSNDTLRSPCCRNAWFHRDCIQRYAVTAGAYFFKCPLCNNKDLFEAEMLQFGIYIPEQDAAWEQEPNAFQELLERYSHCDADKCLCPQGRRHEGSAGSRWEVIRCAWCGSSGTHFGCRGFTKISKESVCKECAEINSVVEKDQKKKHSASSTSPALTVEEIRRNLEQRRSASLRAQRAARRHGSPSSESCSQQPSTSNVSPSQLWRDQNARVVSPTLLRDDRLTSSIPVVRIERAERDINVNVTDSDSEVSEADSEDSQASGSARLRGVPECGSARLRGHPHKAAGTWDVKGVIEKGQRKVVLLSMQNQQGYSSDSSVHSTTSAMQSQMTLGSRSQNSETDDEQELPSAQDSDTLHTRRQRRQSRVSAKGSISEQESSTGEDAPKKRGPGRPRKIRRNFFSSNRQSSGSDNNNNLSSESSVERENQSPTLRTPKISQRQTRSALSSSPSFRLRQQKRVSESSSEERDSDQSLPRIGMKRQKVAVGRGKSTLSAQKRHAKGMSGKYHSDSPDSPTPAESMTTKVRQQTEHSSLNSNKNGCDDAESYDSNSKSKSGLSTDVRGLRSSSEPGGNSQQADHTTSTATTRDVWCQLKKEPGTIKSEALQNSSAFHSVADTFTVSSSSTRREPFINAEPEKVCQKASILGVEKSVKPPVNDVEAMQLSAAYSQFRIPKPPGIKPDPDTPISGPLPGGPGVQCPDPGPSATPATESVLQLPAPASATRTFHMAVPTTQMYQLGVLAVQPPLEAVSATQAGPSTVTSTQSYPMALVAGTPMPFLQWFPVSQGYPNQPQPFSANCTAQPHQPEVSALSQPVPVTAPPPYPVVGPPATPSATLQSRSVVTRGEPPVYPFPVLKARLDSGAPGATSQPYPAAVSRAEAVSTSTAVSGSSVSVARPSVYPVAVHRAETPNAVGSSFQPHALTVSTASTGTVSSVHSQPYPVALSAVPGQQIPVTPVQPSLSASSQLANLALQLQPSAAVYHPVGVRPTTHVQPPLLTASTRPSAPVIQHQTAAHPVSQPRAPVPVSLYAVCHNPPASELSHAADERNASGSNRVVPVSLFSASSVNTVSDSQQQAVPGVVTSKASQLAHTVMMQQLNSPVSYQPSGNMANMLRSAGLLCETEMSRNQQATPAATVTSVQSGSEAAVTAVPASNQQIRTAQHQQAVGGQQGRQAQHQPPTGGRQAQHQPATGGQQGRQAQHQPPTGGRQAQHQPPTGDQQGRQAQHQPATGGQQGRQAQHQPPTGGRQAQHQPPTGDQQGRQAQHQPPTGDQQGRQAQHQPATGGQQGRQAQHQPPTGGRQAQHQPPTGDQQGRQAQHQPPTGDQQGRQAQHQPPTGGRQAQRQPPTGGRQAQHQPPTGGRQAQHQPATGGRQAQHQPATGGQQGRQAQHQPATGDRQGRQAQHQPPTGDQQGRQAQHQPATGGRQGRQAQHQPPTGSQQGRQAQHQPPTGSQQGRQAQHQPATGGQQGRQAQHQPATGGQQGRQAQHQPATEPYQNKPERNQPAAGSQQIQTKGNLPSEKGRDGPSGTSAVSRGQQTTVTNTVLPSASQPDEESREEDAALPMSRGKIWLSPAPMQALLSKGSEVVFLSDSDDSDSELRITGLTPARKRTGAVAGFGRQGHKHTSSCPLSKCQKDGEDNQQQSACTSGSEGKTNPNSPPSTPGSQPSYGKPPCPVHGYHRIVRHPMPSVPAKRNPDGSLMIDLTSEEPVTKKPRAEQQDVATVSSDSDIEIIG